MFKKYGYKIGSGNISKDLIAVLVDTELEHVTCFKSWLRVGDSGYQLVLVVADARKVSKNSLGISLLDCLVDLVHSGG